MTEFEVRYKLRTHQFGRLTAAERSDLDRYACVTEATQRSIIIDRPWYWEEILVQVYPELPKMFISYEMTPLWRMF